MGVDLQLVSLSRRRKEIDRFLEAGSAVYRGDPLWVAPLLADNRKRFSDRNPFFRHADMSLWVASQGGWDVGRIAGILDHFQREPAGERTAHFGFFESVNDRQVSHVLLKAVVAWARQQGATRLIGPMNPSANDECGLLVEGFDRPPVLMMTYNPPYYEDLIVAEGFSRAKDLQAFYINVADCPIERLERVVLRFHKRERHVRIRPIQRSTLREDLPKLKEVYNAAWNGNWGFVPMTDAEIDFLAERLRPLLTEGLSWIAENSVEPMGFLLALPDFNEAIRPLRGRLLTPRLVAALPYLLGRKVPEMARVIALGVKESFRGRGVEVAMLSEAVKIGRRMGIRAAEASWVLEDNLKTRQTIEAFGGKPYKMYRLYQLGLR